MSDDKKQRLTDDARGLAKWFEVEVTLKIFGHTIWHYKFPPEKDLED